MVEEERQKMVLVVTIEKGDSGTDSGSDGRRTKKNGVGCDKKGDSGGGSGNMGGGEHRRRFLGDFQPFVTNKCI